MFIILCQQKLQTLTFQYEFSRGKKWLLSICRLQNLSCPSPVTRFRYLGLQFLQHTAPQLPRKTIKQNSGR